MDEKICAKWFICDNAEEGCNKTKFKSLVQKGRFIAPNCYEKDWTGWLKSKGYKKYEKKT